jgi:hypothetical protein
LAEAEHRAITIDRFEAGFDVLQAKARAPGTLPCFRQAGTIVSNCDDELTVQSGDPDPDATGAFLSLYPVANGILDEGLQDQTGDRCGEKLVISLNREVEPVKETHLCQCQVTTRILQFVFQGIDQGGVAFEGQAEEVA